MGKKEISLMNLLGGKIRFDSKYSTDEMDIFILKKINGGIEGTINLSKVVKMAPKNLINRIKKYQRLNLIEITKTPQKPKGWKRYFKLSKNGKEWIKSCERLIKLKESFLSKN